MILVRVGLQWQQVIYGVELELNLSQHNVLCLRASDFCPS